MRREQSASLPACLQARLALPTNAGTARLSCPTWLIWACSVHAKACIPHMLFIAVAYVVERAIKVYQQRPNSGACTAGRRRRGHLQSGGLLSSLRGTFARTGERRSSLASSLLCKLRTHGLAPAEST